MSTTPIADMVARLIAAGTPADIAAAVVAEAFAAGVATLPVTLPVTAVTPLPPNRSRKAINQAVYRERLKQKQSASVAMAAAQQPATPAVTQPVTPGNGVTSPPIYRSSEGGLFASDEVKKEDVATPPLKPRAREKRAGTRITDDWRPDDKGMKFAADRGLRLFEIEIEITKFRNYWINRTDRDACKPRWDLAWQNWILNVKGTVNERAGQVRTHPTAGPAQTHGDAVIAGVARFAARYAQGKSAAHRSGVSGRPDVAGGADAERSGEGGDSGARRQPQLRLAGDT